MLVSGPDFVRRFIKERRIARFAIASLCAAGTSAIVFAILYVLGVSTTVCSIVAFFAGAVPNWTLNRKWTWKVEGRVALGREIVAYLVISGSTLALQIFATGWTHRHVQSIAPGHGVRVLLVTGSYFAVLALLYGVRFFLYERWIFAGRSRVRTALRSWGLMPPVRHADLDPAVPVDNTP
jgi:putative flippase GtrA